MINKLLFGIPLEFASGISSGSLVRVGTLLKDSATGRIVGHIQESGITQQLLSGITKAAVAPQLAMFDSVVNVVGLASSVYSNVQLNQLKKLVESLQVLQYANIGVAVAGIGVSAIGFGIMNAKLKNIESNLDQLSSKVDNHFQLLIERDLRQHYSQVYNLLEKSDLAHNYSNPVSEWMNVSSQLADESGFFRGELGYLIGSNSFNIDLFASLLRSLTICNSARIECLMLANEMRAAHDLSINIGQNYSQLFDNISPKSLVNKIGVEGDQSVIKNLVAGVRDITDAALTKPMLIESVIEQGISGPEFVLAVKDEKEQPLLLIRPSNS